ILKLSEDFAEKIVWGSRYPHQDTTSAWDAIEKLTEANVAESTMARNAGRQRIGTIRNPSRTESGRRIGIASRTLKVQPVNSD
ncbi:MAG TPA: hypothetical protein VK782_11300, partial [Candidatus Sulfotelmatobacter sp.]|nr:hypothetical protein [Candidatus Sulfotelmatobacter sp.]